MWTSVRKVYHPVSPSEAHRLAEAPGAVLFAGGSYLVADRDPQIRGLVDLGRLLDGTLRCTESVLSMGAGATLQDLVDHGEGTREDDAPAARLVAEAARSSCVSKNIRNQRTLGGELGRGRPDSEICVLLQALDARITVWRETESEEALRDWDGDGVITRISLSLAEIRSCSLQRFAVIPSARPLFAAAGRRHEGGLDLTAGGRLDEQLLFPGLPSEAGEDLLHRIAARCATHLLDDGVHSSEYMYELILKGLKRVLAEL